MHFQVSYQFVSNLLTLMQFSSHYLFLCMFESNIMYMAICYKSSLSTWDRNLPQLGKTQWSDGEGCRYHSTVQAVCVGG